MKLVIFDCDGTIVDSQIGIVAAMHHAFAEVGLALPTRTQVLSVVGLSLPETFHVLAADHPPQVRAELERVYRSDFTYARTRALCGEPLFPGARETIESLAGQDDVILGIATGKSQRGVRRILDREGWHGLFATIQTADENPSKPAPDMILQAMRQTGASPAETIMIGDTTYDVLMAVNAGVRAIGVTWGYHDPGHLHAAGASALASQCEHLPPIIEQMFHVKQSSEPQLS